MKKVFLFFALVVTANVMAATTITKTVKQLASDYQWQNDQCYVHFALDEVISVGSVAGTAKYLSNSQEMRYYQNSDKGYGSMIFTAKPGYVITSIKLNYAQTSARSVACVHWYNGNQKVSVSDTLGINQPRSFYSNQVVIYVGRVTNETGGQIRVREYTVTYEEVATSRMLTRSVMDLAMQNKYGDGTHPIDFTFNNAITMHSYKSTLKYYVNNRGLTSYQNNKDFWILARKGAKIKTVRIIYYPGKSDNKEGVLVQNFVNEGKAVAEEDRIASNQLITVNGDSVHFNSGNIYDATGAQIIITGVHIEYEDSLSQFETFANCPSDASNEEINFTGDNGYYTWKMKNFQRRDSNAIYDYAGTRVFYNGYIATDGVQEGGIKDVSFDWRMVGTANPITEVAKFTVKAGDQTDNYSVEPTIKSAGHIMNYTKVFEVKKNCDFSIQIGEKESTAQTQPVFGPISITPYLLYTNKAVTVLAKDYEPGFKYTNTDLINNTTDNPVVYTIEGENADQIASVDPSTGEVTLLGQGVVTVKASWEEVSTTYTLNVVLEDAGLEFEKQDTTASALAGTFHQPLSKSTLADVTYSIAGEAGTTSIDADGIVSFTEAGTLTITAIVAQQLPYLADTAVYTLTILREKPEISFDQDTVTKTVIDEPFVILPATPVGVGDTTFTSSNPAVATIDALTGEVTIVAKGETTIKAEIAQNGVYEAANASYLLIVEDQATRLNDYHHNNQLRKVVLDGTLRIYRGENGYSILGTTVR